MLNVWAAVEYVTKYATKAPVGSKSMREVLRDSMAEVCKYTREGEPLDLMRRGLQKFYTRTLGGRDYGIFEAVHVGLGLPLVIPLMPVVTLNTQGTRALKSAEHLAKVGRGGVVVWDSKLDKFDQRLSLLRQGLARSSAQERSEWEGFVRDVSMHEFYWKYYFVGRKVKKSSHAVALQITPSFSAECAAVGHERHEAYARAYVIAFWRHMATLDRYRMIRAGGGGDRRKWGGTLFEQPPEHAGAEASVLDRYLGVQDLYEAFEGPRRREMLWDHGRWQPRTSVRRESCGWAFALMEMLVDPVLHEWVPSWVVEQFERRNPGFREAVETQLKLDSGRRLSNRALLLRVR